MSMDHYRKIPAEPAIYDAGGVLGRIVDGLGFRYHWATEGLTRQALEYRPADSGRSVEETLHHIRDLVAMVDNAFTGERFELGRSDEDLPFEELRGRTLDAIRQLSDRCRAAGDDSFADMPIKFRLGGKELDFPFWNAINGPVSDAVYHVGQVVAHRRATGNPIDPGVDVFHGKRRDPR